MARKSKKILITTKSREILTVKESGIRAANFFCPSCQENVEMLTLDSATFITGKTTRQLFKLAENGLVHSIESETGHLLICLDSLSEYLGKNPRR